MTEMTDGFTKLKMWGFCQLLYHDILLSIIDE